MGTETMEEFKRILEKSNSKDPKEAFEGSIEMARYCGVPEDKILKSKEEIDRYFLGESKRT